MKQLIIIAIPLACSLLAIWFAGCGESETIVTAPTGKVLKGTFVLTKAVTHELADVGGPDLDDPVIIRRVPSTYVYPDGTGRLELDEDTINLDAPLPILPLKISGGRFKAVEELYQNNLPRLYYKRVSPDEFTTKLVLDLYLPVSGLVREYGKYPYEWIGDTLKLEFWTYGAVLIYELYWTRDNLR